MTGVYVLGGHQSDFSRNWHREGASIYDLFADTVQQALHATQLNPSEIGVGHVGNFTAPLFTGQSHLGGFFGHVDSRLANLPASSHEAACASGSMALLAAVAEIEAGFYDTACVVGIELMRNVPGRQAASHLRGAAWADREWTDTDLVWPCAFNDMLMEYERRYGIDHTHLSAISKKNFDNARANPNAQTRSWTFEQDSFSSDDALNPPVAGRLRRQDCGQVTDGAAVVFLASADKAQDYARRLGIPLASLPRIKGWGHINAPLGFKQKLQHAEPTGHLLPHVRELIEQALARASLDGIEQIDAMEVHDCFSITEYMILDHLGLYAPGEAWRAVESGETERHGRLPINSSGGLIGLGHPVGATGVRMLLDAYKQSSGVAGDCQIEAANNVMTCNLGGSATTCASFVVGRDL